MLTTKDQKTVSDQALRGVSIIICCYNSAWVIGRTLEALLAQMIRDIPSWEIIVVDNKSTDGTPQDVEAFRAKHPELPLRLVSEQEQGLSHARVKGYREVRHDVIIYCDDDNLLDSDYAQTVWDLMRDHPSMGLCGGFGLPLCETSPDPRILPFMSRYATGAQGAYPDCDITERGFVYGVGMAMRKSALDLIFAKGFQYLSTGRKGGVLSGGEDVELGHAIRAAGYRIRYCEKMRYEHVLTSRRLTWDYLDRMAHGNGYSSVLMQWPSTVNSFKSHPLYVALWIHAQILRSGVPVLFGKVSDEQRLRFSGLLGSRKAILREFRGIFEKRRIARNYFQLLSQERATSSLAPSTQ